MVRKILFSYFRIVFIFFAEIFFRVLRKSIIRQSFAKFTIILWSFYVSWNFLIQFRSTPTNFFSFIATYLSGQNYFLFCLVVADLQVSTCCCITCRQQIIEGNKCHSDCWPIIKRQMQLLCSLGGGGGWGGGKKIRACAWYSATRETAVETCS